ncbi:MAG: HAD family phosphatase [Candidatus Aenigmatarchaeota archaeon]
MIKAVIFDMGGVVLDYSMNMAYKYLSGMLETDIRKLKYTISCIEPEFMKGKINKYEFWKSVSRKLGIKYNRKLASTLWLRNYAVKSRMRKDVINIAIRLKRNGYRTVMISNTIKDHVAYNKKRRRYRFFNPVILSCDVGMVKPDKNIYLLAAKRLKLKPRECVFIDDAKINVIGARKAGMKAIHFRNPRQLKVGLRRMNVII